MFRVTTAILKIRALKNRLKIIQGGSSAGKTIGIISIFIDKAQKKYPYRRLSSIVSEHVPHLKRGVIRDFRDIMETQGYWDENRWNQSDFIYTFETGNQIEFFGADDSDKVRGPRRNGDLFMNEANNMDYETYVQLAIRTSGDIYLDYNPVSEFWAHTELAKQEHDFLILTYKDNEGVPGQIVKEIESRRNNKQFWRVYGEGQIGLAEGIIYPHWKPIDSIPAEARLERRWLDYGYSNDPTAIGGIYKWNDSWILDEELYTKGLLNNQIADFILAQDQQVAVAADSAEPKSNAELQARGLIILPSRKGKDSVNNGIQLVQSQQIFVTKNSLNIWKEQRNYQWLVDKDGKSLNEPTPLFNHHMDGIRYGFQSILDGMPSDVRIRQLRQFAMRETAEMGTR